MVGDGAEVVQAACQLGFEGIVCKSRSAPYREGRGGAWLKVTCVQSDEFVVIAYTAGQAARAELGSILLAQPTRDGRPWRCVGRVGGGLPGTALADLMKRSNPARAARQLANPQHPHE